MGVDQLELEGLRHGMGEVSRARRTALGRPSDPTGRAAASRHRNPGAPSNSGAIAATNFGGRTPQSMAAGGGRVTHQPPASRSSRWSTLAETERR